MLAKPLFIVSRPIRAAEVTINSKIKSCCHIPIKTSAVSHPIVPLTLFELIDFSPENISFKKLAIL